MRRIRFGLALVTAAAGLVFAGPAAADFIDQYQEPLPTGGGNDHSGGGNNSGGGGGGGSSDGGSGGLGGSTISDLQDSVSAPVADALTTVATSPELGAPQKKLGGKKRSRGGEDASGSGGTGGPEAVAAADGSPLGDSIRTAAGGSSPYLLAVLLAVGALTLAGAVLAAVRRGRRAPGS